MHQLRQEFRQKLEQYLQPQQILRSELIQMPTLELELRVRTELQENPFLEEVEEEQSIVEREHAEVETEAGMASYESPAETADLSVSKQEEQEILKPKSEEMDWDNFLNDDEEYVYKASRYPSDELVEAPRPFVQSLSEHLEEQLQLQPLTPDELKIGQYIIGSINKDGYLNYPIEEIARELRTVPAFVEKVLYKVQQLDPPGIAARNLQECLLIQLRQYEKFEKAQLAIRVITETFEALLNKRYEEISRKLNVTLDEVKHVFEEIKKLNPKPGEGYFDEKQNYIIPDLVVHKVVGLDEEEDVEPEFVVYLNDGNIPNFHINTTYKDMFLAGNTDKKVKEFVTKKLESARWFLNAIHQRRTTILRTMRAIVKRQEAFFLHGKEFLKPMILQDIAEEIGMDISTISRVTSGKYVQTEWGVYELKYFFSERMETLDGEEVSTKVIKQRLQEIIEGENKIDPLSDQTIADMLAKEGFPIARRTVQKYREQLAIPVKRLRREI